MLHNFLLSAARKHLRNKFIKKNAIRSYVLKQRIWKLSIQRKIGPVLSLKLVYHHS